MRAVDDEAAAVDETEFLPAAGPLDEAQRSAGLGVVNGQSRRQLAGEQSRTGVTTLVFAGEVRLGQAGSETIADEMERGANFTGAGDDDGFGFRRNIAHDAGHAGLDDTRLLRSDGGKRRAEVFLVVEADGRDHANFRRADIRGVESAAEARLENRDIDLAFGELQERSGSDQFEESRGVLGILSADGFVMRTQAFGEGDDGCVAQRGAIDLDAFTDRDEVRAGVGLASRPAQRQLT